MYVVYFMCLYKVLLHCNNVHVNLANNLYTISLNTCNLSPISHTCFKHLVCTCTCNNIECTYIYRHLKICIIYSPQSFLSLQSLFPCVSPVVYPSCAYSVCTVQWQTHRSHRHVYRPTLPTTFHSSSDRRLQCAD